MGSLIAARMNRMARKVRLVEQFGGGCQRCGYNRCMRALQFHHKDSSEKKAWSKSQGRATFREIELHPERFELLCANCHFEEHDILQEEERVYAKCLKCGKRFQVKKCLVEKGKDKFCGPECRDDALVKPEETPESIAERFHRYVEKTDGCWNWIGAMSGGFPMMSIRGGRNRNKTITAKRVSYELHRGPIGKNLKVKETCRNPLCVNPAHLSIQRMGRPHGYTFKVAASKDQGKLF